MSSAAPPQEPWVLPSGRLLGGGLKGRVASLCGTPGGRSEPGTGFLCSG